MHFSKMEIQRPTIHSIMDQKSKEIKHMEDLIHTAQNRQEKFSKTWQQWNMFIYSDEGQALRESILT